MRRASNHFAGRGLHLDMHEAAVPVKKRYLVNEFVSGVAEPRGQRLGLALRAGEFERGEGLEQVTGLDLLAGLGGVEADRLHRGGMLLRFGGVRRG